MVYYSARKLALAGGSFSEVFPSLSRCGSYCDKSGQLVAAQQCGRNQICCGHLQMRTCCDTSTIESSNDLVSGLWRDTTCAVVNPVSTNDDHDDAVDVDDNKESLTTTTVSTINDLPGIQWWWFTVPLVTMTCLMITLAICYCIRYQEMCQHSRHVYDARNRALTDSSVNSQTPCHVDFDPSSDFAFAPPAYDSLPKNPPTYDEICANINESFWIGENNRETPPPPPFRRASGTSADDQQQQQQPNIAVTPEPPYVEVIY